MNDKKSIEEINNCVRRALPLMSKLNIPVTPKHYAVWYNYFNGGNKELKKVINAMFDKGLAFSEEINKKLYWQFCSEKEEKELRNIRKTLQGVSTTLLTEVNRLSGQAEDYESSISNTATRLSEDVSIQEIKDVVGIIINETKALAGFGEKTKQKLKETTEELEELQIKFEQAKTDALVDFLTGAPNRKAFDETLIRYTKKAESDHKDLCLLIIDIDHFKKFNDEFGHVVGDDVLIFVANKIKGLVRGQDFLARFGGEEFVIILPETALAGAMTVAEHIRHFFAQAKLKTVKTSKPLGKITASIGIACYQSGESMEEFIKRSDQALYFAKESGRNQVATESDLIDLDGKKPQST